MPYLTGSRPKVFLSHSKADIEFIQRLDNDLRHCQIDPWLDSEEIRHGQPWLDAIFEGGIPTCDAVLVYLTSASIPSPMVKKEIDAGIIKKLRDSHIAFLPYVADAKLRDSLRADIQALQTPEWNLENYTNMLPKVVAEIWHSFLDRVIISISNEERVKRLEAELELEKLKKSGEEGIFDKREVSDFGYIWQRLDRYESVEFQLGHYLGQKKEILETYGFRVHLQNLVVNLDGIMRSEYDSAKLRFFFSQLFSEKLPQEDSKNGIFVVCSQWPELTRELLMFGLLQRATKTETPFGGSDTFQLRTSYSYLFTEKMYRFKYWLAHSGQLSDVVIWKSSQDLQTISGSTTESSPTEN